MIKMRLQKVYYSKYQYEYSNFFFSREGARHTIEKRYLVNF